MRAGRNLMSDIPPRQLDKIYIMPTLEESARRERREENWVLVKMIITFAVVIAAAMVLPRGYGITEGMNAGWVPHFIYTVLYVAIAFGFGWKFWRKEFAAFCDFMSRRWH